MWVSNIKNCFKNPESRIQNNYCFELILKLNLKKIMSYEILAFQLEINTFASVNNWIHTVVIVELFGGHTLRKQLSFYLIELKH